MKKSIISIGLVFSLVLIFAVTSFAAGMPALHGVSGREFGKLVSGLEPGAISEHVSMKEMETMVGMPALHGVSGREFGKLVSDLDPGAISEHVRH